MSRSRERAVRESCPAPPLARARPRGSESPELLLQKASRARTPATRAKYAKRGLAHPDGVDLDTRALLLRQLYLSQMEGRRFREAHESALLAVATGVMPDVARQDAARACLGLGDHRKAVEHLRIATRVCPASRRAFHLWTLGSSLYLAGAHQPAVGALTRAVRWGTRDKPLYRAQLALARLEFGDDSAFEELRELRDALESVPCGQGYGQFVLGELTFHLGESDAALRYLDNFVKRSTTGRIALQVALEAEVNRAQELITKLIAGED